jgi:hypothetical protein
MKNQLTDGDSIPEYSFVWLSPLLSYCYAPLSFHENQGREVTICRVPYRGKEFT